MTLNNQSLGQSLGMWADGFAPASVFGLRVGRFFDDAAVSAPARPTGRFAPVYEVEERPDHYLLSLEVPGVRQEDLRLEAKDGRLEVSGERKPLAGGKSAARRFAQAFVLPKDADSSGVEARHENGVLSVAIPKARSAQPREIPIGGGAFKFLAGAAPAESQAS